MREEILKCYFEGTVSAERLSADVKDARQKVGKGAVAVYIEDMQGEDFTVTRDMAIQLCDDVLRGALPPHLLQPIGFALIASDKFIFDGDTIEAEVIHDWSCPEVNYPLTVETVQQFKKWLRQEEPYPEKKGLASSEGKIISVTEKRRLSR